jgi:hypothetical protein
VARTLGPQQAIRTWLSPAVWTSHSFYNPENHDHGNILDALDHRARIENTKALISARHAGGDEILLASRAWNFGTTTDRPPAHDAIIEAAAAATAIATTTRRRAASPSPIIDWNVRNSYTQPRAADIRAGTNITNSITIIAWSIPNYRPSHSTFMTRRLVMPIFYGRCMLPEEEEEEEEEETETSKSSSVMDSFKKTW